jgi:hypothetical protein
MPSFLVVKPRAWAAVLKALRTSNTLSCLVPIQCSSHDNCSIMLSASSRLIPLMMGRITVSELTTSDNVVNSIALLMSKEVNTFTSKALGFTSLTTKRIASMKSHLQETQHTKVHSVQTLSCCNNHKSDHEHSHWIGIPVLGLAWSYLYKPPFLVAKDDNEAKATGAWLNLKLLEGAECRMHDDGELNPVW